MLDAVARLSIAEWQPCKVSESGRSYSGDSAYGCDERDEVDFGDRAARQIRDECFLACLVIGLRKCHGFQTGWPLTQVVLAAGSAWWTEKSRSLRSQR